MHVKYLIIGAGPAGLGAAYKLKELGENDYLLVERNPWAGGLATSFVDDAGFTWDIGGHVQFSHYKYFDEAMEVAIPKEKWLEHERESWVWIKDRFVPYPFQNNIRYLPKESIWKCVKGIIEATKNQSKQRPANFHEWIVATFGQGVADEFMLPYNFKVWAHHPKDMAYQWIGERVSVVDLERILENIILEKMDASWGPNNTFKFPLHGGTGAIWKSLANHAGSDKILLNTSVDRISARKREALLSDGQTIKFDYILSTVPVDHLTWMVKEVPSHLRFRSAQLKHSSSHIIGIGLEGQAPLDVGKKCWMYFPEDNAPFYRVTVFSNYSPHNVPDVKNQYSMMCEVSESPYKPVNRKTVVEETVQGLINTKLIRPTDKILTRWYYCADYGYPTPSLERDEILCEVVPYLDDIGIYSRGRFGAWEYEISNQDHTFMQGVEWAAHIVTGQAEETFKVPAPPPPRLTAIGRRA